MLNEEKVKLMTSIALYEQKDGKKEIPMSKYYKGDYISIHMISAAIISTIAFILLILIWFVFKVDYFMDNLSSFDIFSMTKQLITIYLIFILVNLLISYIVSAVKFIKVRDSLKRYNADLKKLYKFYAQNDKKKEEIVKGGNNQDGDTFSI